MMKVSIKLSAIASILILMASPLAQARLLLVTGGEIQALSNTSMRVGDLAFPLSPTVKVLSAGKKPISLQALKLGDTVKVEVHEVAGKRFIDRITVIPGKKRQ